MISFVLIDSLIESFVLFGFWFLLVGNASRHELLVGAFCAFLGAFSDALVKASGFARFYVRPYEVGQALLVPGYILRDTWTVILETFHRVTGGPDKSRWLSLPYERTEDTEADRADRALVTAFSTMSPNEIAIGVDRKKKRLYIHQLVPRSASLLVQNLGVKK